MRFRSLFAFGALAVLAACVQTPAATPDRISFDYDPRFWTKTAMHQMADDHCAEQGKAAFLASDVEKTDASGDRMVTFRCMDSDSR